MGHQTPLYAEHRALNARIVDFGGWDMPVQYKSVLEEHHAVRRSVGMFDVSHMTFLEIEGPDAVAYLQHVLANDVTRLKQPGKALYSAMLNPQGGVIDDLIVYAPTETYPGRWRMIVNCGTREKDLAWLQQQMATFRVTLVERTDMALIAVQGPQARARVAQLRPEIKALVEGLAVFQAADHETWFIARTGYTGEDGLEILLPEGDAPAFWRELLAEGVVPCGLGARDTLRLEAGMNLYGHEMDDNVSPLAANMAWTIAWDHEFVGKAALVQAQQDNTQQLVGLMLEGKGVLRAEMLVITEKGEGITTSGTFSPTLEKSIALARVPKGDYQQVEVEIRGKRVLAKVVKPVFARNGKSLY
jgi:aminomethyltransferase